MPRRTLLLLAVIGAALLAAAPAHAFDEAGYWAYADHLQERMDPLWDEQAGRYRPGPGGVETMVNANELLTHAVAALRGHDGPARDDRRARALVRSLLAGPPYVRTVPPPNGASQIHAPGWLNTMDSTAGQQHLVIDAEVVDGLTHAWLARRALGLTQADADLIARRIHAVASGPFWRWPAIRLNQINWYALVYAADATVTGDPRMLRRDLRAQIARFVADARGTATVAGNLGPGLRFHYMPRRPAAARLNVDSAEYGNIVASFTRFYGAARRAGMAAPPAAARRMLREWLGRVLAGYWTHAGYLNWDSGLGFNRWHQAKKIGLAQQALLGIATARELRPGAAAGGWAKWLFDRGLAFYARLADRSPGGIAPGVLFDLSVVPQGIGAARLGAARMEANAARAVMAGLGEPGAPVAQPPALYAFDPDIGRLAVTTPAYNTAIVAVSQGAFPYGGIEIARLFDADQDVAAGIGGRPPATFGLYVRDVSGRRVLATQLPRTSLDPRVTPLRLTRAPLGAGATSAAAARGPRRAFAGPFRDLRAEGEVRSRTLAARTSHRFAPAFVETRWSLRRLSGTARDTVDVLFPSWGADARAVAVLRDGRRVAVGGERLPLGDVAYFHVVSDRSGYVVVPLDRPAAAAAHLIRVGRQSSAPDAGPTLAVQLARASRAVRAAFAVRLAPAHGADEAAATAARLGAR